MLFKKSFKKFTSLAVAIAIVGGMTISDVEAASKAIKVPSKAAYSHSSIIGKNRADTSNIIVSNSNKVNDFILVNQYSGLSYALMNSANAAKTGSYILPINENNIPKEHRYFSASDETVTNLKFAGNSKSFDDEFVKDLSYTYAKVEKNISNNISRASVDNLNKNFSNASTVFIVNGDKGLADAMSIAPVSYRDQSPILFTTKDGKKIDGYSKKSGVNYVVVGGNKVVSDSLAKEYNATRLAGATRYETNKVVLDKYYPNRDMAYFTNGDTLVDALSSVHMTKDDGIVLVNRKKNHNLISNIATYQIGGVAGYQFKYKNEDGKLYTASKVSAKKNKTIRNATTRNKVYQHKINSSKIYGARINKENVYRYVLNRLKNGRVDFYGNEDDIFREILSVEGAYFGSKADGFSNWREIGKNHYTMLEEDLLLFRKSEPKFEVYRKELKRALESMNLNCSNEEMLNQINDYLCENYSYKITNGATHTFVSDGCGQCMHYALAFNDMCKAVGIEMQYVEGEAKNGGYHGWNMATFDGIKYYFDVTWNDTGGGPSDEYMWCSTNPHRKITIVYYNK